MRVSLIIGLLGLSGCSAMATMQTDLESQPAVVSEKPQPSKPAPQKVNPAHSLSLFAVGATVSYCWPSAHCVSGAHCPF